METKKKDKSNKAEKANKMDIKKMTALAMFSVIALTIFTAESMIGPIVPIPGIKLGLANIVTLLVLVLYGPKEAVFVLIVRILLGSMFGGQMISFFYSLSGGILCWLVMSLISVLLKKKFLVLISMCGAAAHNRTNFGCHCDYTFYKRGSIFTCFDAQRNDHRLLYWTGCPGVLKETAKDLKSEVFLTAKFTIRHMTREQ